MSNDKENFAQCLQQFHEQLSSDTPDLDDAFSNVLTMTNIQARLSAKEIRDNAYHKSDHSSANPNIQVLPHREILQACVQKLGDSCIKHLENIDLNRGGKYHVGRQFFRFVNMVLTLLVFLSRTKMIVMLL